MSKIDLRDGAGGYGTDMYDVRMDMRANTPRGDRDKDDVVNLSAFEAETLVNSGVAHLVRDEAPARAVKGAKRRTGDHPDAEHRMATSGDHTRSVTRS